MDEYNHDQMARMKMLADHQRGANGAIMRTSKGKMIRFKKLEENAKAPTRANASDAGWDLYSTEQVSIPKFSRLTVKTGISLEMPPEMAGLIWPRSGMAVKKGIDVFAGVVDSGYRGEVMVCLYNSSEADVDIDKGDRIAQIIFHNLPQTYMFESEALNDSERGEGGFGSSGK
mgnify:CR=1 FL=1